MPHQSLGGASYFVSFIDDSTWKVWAYPIRTKDRVFSIFSEWLAMVENQTGRKLKCLQTDNGGEFKSEEFVKFCWERDIRHEYMAPYSSEQSSIAEHMKQTIQEHVVSMLQHSRLSDGLWAEALHTAVHKINMSPSRPLGLQIPQEIWTGSKPNYDKLRIFGCEAYALIPKDDRRKLEPRSRKCVFLGYGPDGEIRYLLWDPEHRQIVRCSDVVFKESAMHKKAESPIEVRRVIFSEVPTFHEGPTHNTRSVSRVTDTSRTESTDSAQPNGSASDHPTSTPGATSPVIP